MPETVLNRVANVLTGSSGGAPWACLPARPPRQPRRPLPPLPDVACGRKSYEKLGAEDLLVLDFATLALNRGGQVDGEPSEMVVSMRPGGTITREGVSALVGLMNKVLDMPDVYGWFTVLFDFRPLPKQCQQLEPAMHIMRWDTEPGWQARCMCQCAHCVVLVEAPCFEDAKRQLETWYSFRPPPYCTYLATEPRNDPGIDDDDSAVRFSPPEAWPLPARAPRPAAAAVPPSPGSSAPSTPLPMLGSGAVVRSAAQKLAGFAGAGGELRRSPREAPQRGPCASPKAAVQDAPLGGTAGVAAATNGKRTGMQEKAAGVGAGAASAAAAVPNGKPARAQEKEGERAPEAKVQAAPSTNGQLPRTKDLPGLPASRDCDFAYLTHFERRDGHEELLLETRDAAHSDEALDRVLDYMDAFTRHSVADKGFAITYDLRGLRIPSVSMVMKIAAWGNHPDRKERWARLNIACKIVFSPGLHYTIGKGLVSIFFSQCPPIVRTFILSDPSESEEHAVHFDPAPTAEAPAARAEAAARWAHEARRPAQEPLPESLPALPTIQLLDVGFASLVLNLAKSGGCCEFRLRSGLGPPQQEGVSALLGLLCNTLRCPQVAGEFSLCFDLRSAERPLEALELVLRARRRRGQEWAEVLHKRCKGWYVAVQAGAPFKEVHSTLDCFFYLHPPVVPTRLTTGLGDPGEGPSVVTVEWLPSSGGAASAPRGPMAGSGEALSIEDPVEALAVPPWRGAGVPCTFDAGFLHLSHGVGHLRVQAAKGRPQTQEGLGMVLAFMDDFVHGPHAAGGFAAHFDLRALRLPSLVTVCHLASWGAEPVRRERWERLCVSCAVVVGHGPVFHLAKGLLSKFFSLCPPVCRTHILRDPSEPCGAAFFFDPCLEEADVEEAEQSWPDYIAMLNGDEDEEAAPRAVNGHGRGVANGRAHKGNEPVYCVGLCEQRLNPEEEPWVF